MQQLVTTIFILIFISCTCIRKINKFLKYFCILNYIKVMPGLNYYILCVKEVILPFDGLVNNFLLEPKTKMDQKQPRCRVKHNLNPFGEWLHKSMMYFPPLQLLANPYTPFSELQHMFEFWKHFLIKNIKNICSSHSIQK